MKASKMKALKAVTKLSFLGERKKAVFTTDRK